MVALYRPRVTSCAFCRQSLLLEPQPNGSLEAGWLHHHALLRDLEHALLSKPHRYGARLRHVWPPVLREGARCLRRSARLVSAAAEDKLADLGLESTAGELPRGACRCGGGWRVIATAFWHDCATGACSTAAAAAWRRSAPSRAVVLARKSINSKKQNQPVLRGSVKTGCDVYMTMTMMVAPFWQLSYGIGETLRRFRAGTFT